jgi:hypothetical protein
VTKPHAHAKQISGFAPNCPTWATSPKRRTEKPPIVRPAAGGMRPCVLAVRVNGTLAFCDGSGRRGDLVNARGGKSITELTVPLMLMSSEIAFPARIPHGN